MMKTSTRSTAGNVDLNAPRTRKETAAMKIHALVPFIGLAAVLCLGSLSSRAATVTFGSDNDGLGGFTTSTVAGAESWSTETGSVQYRCENSGTLNSSLLKQYVLDRSPGSSYTIRGVVTMTDGYADDNNRLGMYLFGDSAVIPDQFETGAIGIIFNTDDSVTGGPPGNNANDNLSLKVGIDGTNLSGSVLRGQTPTPFAQDLFGTTITFETTITFVGTNIDIVTNMTDQDGTLTTVSATVPAADYTGDYFGFVNRARARNYPDTPANRGAPWVMDYRSFSINPTSTVIFGSDNDGLGGFTTSTVLAGESWSTEAGSVQYRCENAGTVNSSLLKWYLLDRSPGSSYTITGVVTMTDGYADDNNRLGMYLFGDSDVIPDQFEAGAVGIIFNTDDSVTGGPPGNNADDNLYLPVGIDGTNLSGSVLRNQTPTPFAQDLFGTTVTFKTTITFVGTDIEIVANMTDQNGAPTTVSLTVPAADYAGNYFGFVNRARARNYPDTPANRGAPWVMDYRRFSISPAPTPPVREQQYSTMLTRPIITSATPATGPTACLSASRERSTQTRAMIPLFLMTATIFCRLPGLSAGRTVSWGLVLVQVRRGSSTVRRPP